MKLFHFSIAGIKNLYICLGIWMSALFLSYMYIAPANFFNFSLCYHAYTYSFEDNEMRELFFFLLRLLKQRRNSKKQIVQHLYLEMSSFFPQFSNCCVLPKNKGLRRKKKSYSFFFKNDD